MLVKSLIAGLFVLVLSACGQKGDLYLLPEQTEAKAKSTQDAEPTATEKQ